MNVRPEFDCVNAQALRAFDTIMAITLITLFIGGFGVFILGLWKLGDLFL